MNKTFTMKIIGNTNERFNQGAFDGMVGRLVSLTVDDEPMLCVVRKARVPDHGNWAMLEIEPDVPIKFALLEDDSPSQELPQNRRDVARRYSTVKDA